MDCKSVDPLIIVEITHVFCDLHLANHLPFAQESESPTMALAEELTHLQKLATSLLQDLDSDNLAQENFCQCSQQPL